MSRKWYCPASVQAHRSRDSWWAYELDLLGRALRSPFWFSRWHVVLGPVALAVATIVWDETRSVAACIATLVIAYLLMLLGLLLREPYAHAQRLETKVDRHVRRVHDLESEIRVPPIQRKRLLEAKHLAGLIEAKLTLPQLGMSGLRSDVQRLAMMAGYLAEYRAGEASAEFLRRAQRLWDLLSWGEDPAPPWELEGPPDPMTIAAAREDLGESLKVVHWACDQVLLPNDDAAVRGR